ncbi:acyltransferase [Rothia nasimurium]|uniref:acyltransferase n=1 Tax=Rothia nasimurium TaxID=85336 RepID=UPI001F20DEF6|nr:acyltransferase [Rothia nasimurium]
MPTIVRKISNYKDDKGNEIIYSGAAPIEEGIYILFTGSGNKVTIDTAARIKKLYLRFDSNNGTFNIGSNVGVAPFQGNIRVGEDSNVTVGNNVSTTNAVQISAVEGTKISIGNDVMIAGNVKVRGDDGHPIFDIETGQRVNPAQNITIGDHVWLGIDSTILGGAILGSGSVVGTKALVTKQFPNNVIVAGVPAKVIRENIAWERPHLSVVKPYYKPDSSTIPTTDWWLPTNHTEDPYI